MNLVRLFPRFGQGRIEPSLGDGVMPDLQKFGVQAAKILAATDSADAPIDVDDEPLVLAPVVASASTPTLVAELPNTGDPVLDQVLRSRRDARERLRVLRKELMQERRRLADITAFVRPRVAADNSSTIEEGSVETK